MIFGLPQGCLPAVPLPHYDSESGDFALRCVAFSLASSNFHARSMVSQKQARFLDVGRSKQSADCRLLLG